MTTVQTDSDNTLRATDLRKVYQGRAVVDGVDLRLEQGEIVGLLGPNGAGKTTSFYIIVGFIRPDGGKVFLNDRANLNLNVDYNGKQDDFFFPPVPPFQERVELDDFTLVTVASSYQVTKQLQLFGRVENVLDESYEEVHGYGTLGIGVYGGVKIGL